MKKKIFSIILCLAMVMTLTPSITFGASETEEFGAGFYSAPERSLKYYLSETLYFQSLPQNEDGTEAYFYVFVEDSSNGEYQIQAYFGEWVGNDWQKKDIPGLSLEYYENQKINGKTYAVFKGTITTEYVEPTGYEYNTCAFRFYDKGGYGTTGVDIFGAETEDDSYGYWTGTIMKENISKAKPTIKTKLTKNSITISWSEPKNLDAWLQGYRLERATKKNGTFKKVISTEKMSYKQTKNLKKGTRYYYRVKGYRCIAGEVIYTKYSNVSSRVYK